MKYMRACRGREGVNENLNRQQYHTQTNKMCAKEAQQNGGEQEQANFIMNYSRPMGGTKTEKKNNSVLFLLGPYLPKGKSINQAHC